MARVPKRGPPPPGARLPPHPPPARVVVPLHDVTVQSALGECLVYGVHESPPEIHRVDDGAISSPVDIDPHDLEERAGNGAGEAPGECDRTCALDPVTPLVPCPGLCGPAHRHKLGGAPQYLPVHLECEGPVHQVLDLLAHVPLRSSANMYII
jgi:hypothetical protein